MLKDIKEQLLNKCSSKLKKDMEKALEKYPFPDVFQNGLASSQFKKDKIAEEHGWYEELQYELWSIKYDPKDIEANY